jgi:transposase
LVFVDESGVTRSMTRRYGRAPKGQRVHGAVPLGHWEATTLIGALALGGVRASFSVDAATDADIFQVFVGQVLRPSLRPGDVVIWDNLPAHKRPAFSAILAAAGARLLPLPPYSPDFNPIEQCWSKVKEFLRSAQARTAEALDQAITQAFATVTASDAQGWFQHCGYRWIDHTSAPGSNLSGGSAPAALSLLTLPFRPLSAGDCLSFRKPIGCHECAPRTVL